MKSGREANMRLNNILDGVEKLKEGQSGHKGLVIEYSVQRLNGFKPLFALIEKIGTLYRGGAEFYKKKIDHPSGMAEILRDPGCKWHPDDVLLASAFSGCAITRCTEDWRRYALRGNELFREYSPKDIRLNPCSEESMISGLSVFRKPTGIVAEYIIKNVDEGLFTDTMCPECQIEYYKNFGLRLDKVRSISIDPHYNAAQENNARIALSLAAGNNAIECQ